MSAILLCVHVVLAILAIGPIAVAASIFPRYAETAPVAAVLHRICVTYAVVGVAVPLLGIATAVAMGVLTDAWVLVSIALTVVAAAILVAGAGGPTRDDHRDVQPDLGGGDDPDDRATRVVNGASGTPGARRHAIASAQSRWPSKPSDSAIAR